MKPTQQLFKSISLLLILNLLLKPIWIFLIDRKVQLWVGQEVYGDYFALLNFAIIFSIILDGGLGIYFTANHANNTQVEQLSNFKTLYKLKLGLCLLYIFITTLVAIAFGIVLNKLFLLLLIYQVLNAVLLFARSYFTTNLLLHYDSFISVADKLLATILIGFWLYFKKDSFAIVNFILIQIACTGALLLGCIVYIWRQKNTTPTPSSNIGIHLKKAIPYAVLVLLMSLVLRSDVFLIKLLHPNGNVEVGLYAYGYRLLDALNTFGFLWASFLFPFLCKHIIDKKISSTAVNWSFIVLLSISTIVAMLCFLYRKPIVELLYHTQNITIEKIVSYSCFAFVGGSLVHIFSTVLTAHQKIKQLTITTAFFALLSIVANLILIPQFGASGAVVVNCCVQLLYGVSLAFLCYEQQLISSSWGSYKELFKLEK
jgi:O-antigen/teichoic acid export membrane protein